MPNISQISGLTEGVERMALKDAAKKNPNLPTAENEYGELKGEEYKKRVAAIKKASFSVKLKKALNIIQIISMVLVPAAIWGAVWIAEKQKATPFKEMQVGNTIMLFVVIEVIMALAFIPIVGIKNSGLRELKCVLNRKITLNDDKFVYSNNTLDPNYSMKVVPDDSLLEFTIPYENIKGITHDAKNFRYRIECSEYELHNKRFARYEKATGPIDIIDLFEDPDIFKKIALKASGNTIIGGGVTEGKLPTITHKFDFACIVAMAAFLMSWPYIALIVAACM